MDQLKDSLTNRKTKFEPIVKNPSNNSLNSNTQHDYSAFESFWGDIINDHFTIN